MASPRDTQKLPPAAAVAERGAYDLLAKIASGGMGEVFIARKVGARAFEKRLALKLLLPHLSAQPDFLQLFLDEARLAAQMNHPNIVQVFDLGEAEGRFFIAMALVEGVSLGRLLEACKKSGAFLPLPVVRHIAMGLCEALAYAHDLKGPAGNSLGIVHRDVTPSNVLLSSSGAVLLTDFGVAKAASQVHATRPGVVRGKFAYMPPEQMQMGERLDRRADIYSAGLTLYEALTGNCPFRRSNDVATLNAVRSAEAPDPTTLRADIGPAMAAALVRGISRNREARFATAGELLEAFLDGPVARASELGEWVERLCGDSLAVFRNSTAEPIAAPQTRSLLLVDSSVERAPWWRPLATPRWAIAAGAAGLLLVGASLLIATSSGPAPAAEPGPSDPPAAAIPLAPPAPATPEPSAEAPSAEPQLDRPTGLSAPPARPAIRPPARLRSASAAAARAKVAAPVAPPRLRVGFLSADASPWASLWIDGREIDRTPVSRYPLPVGRYTIVFRNPQLGREVSRTVTVEENQESPVFVDLSR